MGDLTENFSLREFRCKDGTDVPPELIDNVVFLAKNLQVLRQLIGKPVKVISGYRSPAYNKKCGGTKKSQHMQARAADLKVSGMSSDELHAIIANAIKNDLLAPGGIGWYPSFVHYDTRGRNARWKGSK